MTLRKLYGIPAVGAINGEQTSPAKIRCDISPYEPAGTNGAVLVPTEICSRALSWVLWPFLVLPGAL